MAGGRYVVLGLAQARSAWFRSVAQWSNAASVPVEFVKCMSPLELRAHLRSGRPFSALLIDGVLPALDRDLVDEAQSAGCGVIVVDDMRVNRDWRALGASAVVNPMFDRKDLIDILAAHAAPITRSDAVPGSDLEPGLVLAPARVAMVCGPGGTGASTVAIALAQGVSDDVRHGGMVLLADLARRAEQAMLHDARDVVPGVQELVDAHRAGRPGADEVRNLAFAVQARHYDLLLGLRRPRSWSTIRPRAFEAAFDTLCRAWRVVICDTDSDFETEDDGGSADVEERTLMARTAAGRADVVFAIGLPGMKGTHSLVSVIGELIDHDVPAGRIVPVINRGPKSGRAKAELTRALALLLDGRLRDGGLVSPIFLPERRVDEALRDGVRLPAALTGPLAGAFSAITERNPAARAAGPALQAVVPGTLSSWAPEIAG